MEDWTQYDDSQPDISAMTGFAPLTDLVDSNELAWLDAKEQVYNYLYRNN